MEPVPPAHEASPLIRYSFAAIFISACLYKLELGMRIAGLFMLGMALYEGHLGRVPLHGPFSWKTTGYLRGPAAAVVVVTAIFLSGFLIFTPKLVIALLATV